MQGDQIKRKIILSRCQFVKCNEFNPIYIIALKAGISSSLHTIILRKQTQTKHLIDLILFVYIFPFIRTRYIKTIPINTNIDCLNNSKCSVRYIFKATKPGAFGSVFCNIFCYVFRFRVDHNCLFFIWWGITSINDSIRAPAVSYESELKDNFMPALLSFV